MVSIEPSQLVYLRRFLAGNSVLSGVGGSEAGLVGVGSSSVTGP